MKSVIKIVVLLLASAVTFVAKAEPLAVEIVPDGYVVSGRHVATTEQLVGELKSQEGKEFVIVIGSNTPMDKFGALVAALQKQGMKVGFITRPAQQ